MRRGGGGIHLNECANLLLLFFKKICSYRKVGKKKNAAGLNGCAELPGEY